ncbi:TonB-dependent siderophore receptor [Pedobacter mendelii]|nr:TonB-dependent receptor [Pedobacter mendelii]
MKKKLYLLLLFPLFTGSYCFAQNRPATDSTTMTRQLKEVMVSTRRAKKMKKDTVSVGLKLQQPIIQVPQNIISVSAQMIQQQGALQLKDVARNASGVYFGFNSTAFDNSAAIQIRGFSGYTTLNGMPRHQNFGAVLDDPAMFESVEFVKGPAGFINSVGEASGIININTKTPSQKLMNFEVTGGSYSLGRFAFDVGSEVKEHGFSYRLNAAYQHQNSYLDELRTDKYVLAPVVQYNFSPKTYIIAEYDYLRGESRNGSDITKIRSEAETLKDNIHSNYSAANGLPLTYYQTQTARLLGVHKFDDNWQLTSQSQYTSAPLSAWTTLSSETYTGVEFSDNSGVTNRLSYNSKAAGQTFTTQLFLNGKFKTGSIRHTLLTGGDFTFSRDSLVNNFGMYTFPFYQERLNYGVNRDSIAVLDPAFRSRFDNHTKYESVYAYDNIQLVKQLLLTVGARYTWYENKVTQNLSPKIPLRNNNFHQNAWSPRAALTFLVDSATSVYFLYDQSFVPQSGLKAGSTINPDTQKPVGDPVDPQRNNDLELGIKHNWFGSRLLTTINGFHTVKRNVLIDDIKNASLGFKRQIGSYTSNGIEVDVLGNITSSLSVSVNYTYVNARITKDTIGSPLVGFKLPGTPQQIINTWVQYIVPIQRTNSLSLSLGQMTLVKRATYARDVNLADFTKFDAGVTYNAPRYYIRLIGDNLLNKRYIASGDIGDGYPIPDVRNYYFIEGQPINFRISVGFRL